MSSHHKIQVAERLREFFAAGDIKQAEVAAFLGISTSKLGNWLSGRNYPDEYLLTRLCDRYGATTDYFYRGTLFGLPASVADGLAKVQAEFAAQRQAAADQASGSVPSSSAPPKRRGRKPKQNIE